MIATKRNRHAFLCWISSTPIPAGTLNGSVTKPKTARVTASLQHLTPMVLVICATLSPGCGPTSPPLDPPAPAPTLGPTVPPAPGGPALSEAAVVQGLPWLFTKASEILDSGGSTRTTYISTEPIEGSGATSVFLEAFLSTTSFDNSAMAIESFSEQVYHAHPDTGLTYAWDLVLLDGARLYHLHADCLFSEEVFDTMSANLYRIVNTDEVLALRCRCGGGCQSIGSN